VKGPDHALLLAIHKWSLTVETDAQHTHLCPICEMDWGCESPACRAHRVSVCPEDEGGREP